MVSEPRGWHAELPNSAIRGEENADVQDPKSTVPSKSFDSLTPCPGNASDYGEIVNRGIVIA
ncbi:hypothetical protein CGZ80_20850 [Rhodopirellula sp. MGV]|nr:hypothetical protein CGZ80_20850 [Rhodopirellula sp. MGV]PNY33977.1 hypothetical protein C2E31_25825 [Rhodopirellula baltica]